MIKMGEANHKEHIQMWTWLSNHPEKRKTDYFISIGLNIFNEDDCEQIPTFECYACEEAKDRYKRIHGLKNHESYEEHCQYCPIKWLKGKKRGKFDCEEEGSLYEKYCNLKIYDKNNFSKISRFALKIANLKWNELNESEERHEI